MVNQQLSHDQFSEKLNQDVFPSNWKNPQSAQAYDLLVVGGGPGGMTAATIARSMNAKVALVEKEHLGGECLNAGCIPSKAFIRCSRLAADIRHASEFGIDVPEEWKVNFDAVMQRVHRMQSVISPHDSAAHFQNLGVDVFFGKGCFISQNQLEVANQTLTFKKAIVATGTQPIPFRIPGIEPSDYFTNQNIFMISSLPRRLAVIGGGPISCELAQAFCRLGSQVTLITRGKNLLPKDDILATERLREVLEKEGMNVIVETQVQRIEKRGAEKILYLDRNHESIIADAILVGIGRIPAVEELGLEAAHVSYDLKKGIAVDDYLQTSHPNIYAVGDVVSRYKFTHISKELAKIAVLNALNGNHIKGNSLIVPWCTYTDPEVAHTGLTEQDAQDKGVAVESILVELADIDRAILDGETIGFAKLLVKANTDQIVGATIMARHGGEMISEISVAIATEKGLIDLAKTIHPFPTQSQILRTAAETLIKQRKASPRQVPLTQTYSG